MSGGGWQAMSDSREDRITVVYCHSARHVCRIELSMSQLLFQADNAQAPGWFRPQLVLDEKLLILRGDSITRSRRDPDAFMYDHASTRVLLLRVRSGWAVTSTEHPDRHCHQKLPTRSQSLPITITATIITDINTTIGPSRPSLIDMHIHVSVGHME